MKFRRGATTYLLWLMLSLNAVPITGQTVLRVAVFDVVGDERFEVTSTLRELVLQERTSLELLDPALVQAAAQGSGYKGSLNMTLSEAQALGLSLGCDFYLLGKLLIVKRAMQAQPIYYEALASLFVVETRTGQLASFGFFTTAAPTETEAGHKLLAMLKADWTKRVEAMQIARAKFLVEVANVGSFPTSVIEVLNDDQLGQQGQQPIFYQRLKPEYTKEAELMGIAATVEVEAVFQADGKIGELSVTRWAGYGLDQSAINTVQKLRFKPAQQAGKEVTIRGLVRYNFRRPPSMAERQEENERLKRSLRELKNPGSPVPLLRPE